MKRIANLLLVLGMLLIPQMSHASTRDITRIQFAAGATSWHIGDRTIGANLLEEYILKVSQGQYMSVMLTEWPDTNINLTIFGASDGLMLVDMTTGGFWGGYLPSTQDYIIRVANIGAATKYNLSVSIPACIRFAAGGTSATVTGTVGTQTLEYILGARKGQTMTVTLTPNNGTVGLTIYGADGQPLKRSAVGDATWSGVLPATQDYFIVRSSFAGTTATFSMTVSIV